MTRIQFARHQVPDNTYSEYNIFHSYEETELPSGSKESMETCPQNKWVFVHNTNDNKWYLTYNNLIGHDMPKDFMADMWLNTESLKTFDE